MSPLIITALMLFVPVLLMEFTDTDEDTPESQDGENTEGNTFISDLTQDVDQSGTSDTEGSLTNDETTATNSTEDEVVATNSTEDEVVATNSTEGSDLSTPTSDTTQTTDDDAVSTDPTGDSADTTDTPNEPVASPVFAVGTDASETIEGAAGDDELYGLQGNDTIYGLAGDDDLEGNLGDDLISAGAGNDMVAGGGGTDNIFGDDGDDLLSVDRLDNVTENFARGEDETINGGAGNDTLVFSSGDIATGGADADSFFYYDLADTTEAATITDYEPGSDEISLLYNPADYAAEPAITLGLNANGNVTVLLDGRAVLSLAGVTNAEGISVALVDINETIFAPN